MSSKLICPLSPPTQQQCLELPLCNRQTGEGGCSTLAIDSSCLAGFLYIDPLNITHYRPAIEPETTSEHLLQAQCLNLTLSAQQTNNYTLWNAKCMDYCYPNTRACCPGYFCPVGLSCMLNCSKEGSYCPSSDTLSMVQIKDKPPCDPLALPEFGLSLGCGGSTNSTQTCPAGYYCPDSKTKKYCPKDSFCRAGFVKPNNCLFSQYCKEGATQPGGFVETIVILIGLSIIAIFLANWRNVKKCYRKCRDKNFEKKHGYTYQQYQQQRTDNKLANQSGKTFFTDTLQNNSSHNTNDNTSNTGFVELKEVNEEFDDTNYSIVSDDDSILRTKSGKISMNKVVDVFQKHTKISLDFMMDIEFKDLTLKLKTNNKIITNHVNGKLPVGTVTAIMGPSGSGKTSLLFALSGKAKSYANIEGDILINGKKANISDYKDIYGFVPQNDIMHPKLTVKEIVDFNAAFRLGNDKSQKYRKNTVRDVLRLLGLYKIRHTVVGDETERGISGGQKKRVNIGMELVSQPSLLFLDEPTSGLDSTTSNDVMSALNSIAKVGTTVLVVLHQPRYEIYSRFDNVILLAEGGKVAYNGKTENALPYFESLGFELPQHSNPADYLMDVISGQLKSKQQIDYLILPDLWKKKTAEYNINESVEQTKNNYTDYIPRKKASLFQTIYLCMNRNLWIQARSRMNLLSDILMTAFGGGVIGGIADYSNFSKLPVWTLFLLITTNVLGCIISLKTFGDDKLTYYRYAARDINRFGYYLGQILSVAPWIIVQPLVFLMFFYTMAEPRGLLKYYVSVLMLGMFVVQGLAQLISVCVSPSKSQLLSVILVIVLNFLNGVNPTLSTLHNNPVTYAISDCVFSRWEQEALWGRELQNWPAVYDDLISASTAIYGSKIDNYMVDIIMMLILGIIFRVVTIIALYLVNRDKQI